MMETENNNYRKKIKMIRGESFNKIVINYIAGVITIVGKRNMLDEYGIVSEFKKLVTNVSFLSFLLYVQSQSGSSFVRMSLAIEFIKMWTIIIKIRFP